jgi:hypothetical protein
MVTVVLTSSSPVTGKMSKQQNEAERHKPILQHCCKKNILQTKRTEVVQLKHIKLTLCSSDLSATSHNSFLSK